MRNSDHGTTYMRVGGNDANGNPNGWGSCQQSVCTRQSTGVKVAVRVFIGGGLDVIRKEACSFCMRSSCVRVWWGFQEVNGPTGVLRS